MAVNNQSFVFYESFYEAIKSVPSEMQMEMFDAVCNYALYGTQPNLNANLKPLFILIKPQLDSNLKKRNDGFKGGRPPKSETEKPVVIEEKTIGYETENHRLQPLKPNVYVNANSNADVDLKEKEKEESKRVIFENIDQMNENEVFKDLLKDWTTHLLEKGKKLTKHQIETFANNNRQIYGTNAMLFRQDVYFTIENGYLGLVRKHLKEAGFDEYTGKKIPQYDGDYAPIDIFGGAK
jgi:hypothetical protein